MLGTACIGLACNLVNFFALSAGCSGEEEEEEDEDEGSLVGSMKASK